MSALLEPREILSYLNELGYTNITPQQLKDFIKDLKKLIKYERRKQHQKINPPLTEDLPELSRFTTAGSFLTSTTSAASSPAKDAKTKGNVITIEVKRPHQNKGTSTNVQPAAKKISTSGDVNSKEGEIAKEEIGEEKTETVHSKVGKSKSAGKIVALKRTASFIRPRELGLKTCKSDPVALYHWYQAEWKKVNFPGEDRRSHLRWAIRGQMMGRDVPVSATASMDTLARRKRDFRNA